MKAKATVTVLCLAGLTGCQFAPESAQAQTPEHSDGLVLRRLWTGQDADFYAQSISPDGRFITFIDWNVGELAVRDPITGDEVRITDQKQEGLADTTAYQSPGVSVFSRDGGHIAYAWQVGDAFQLRTLDFTVGPDGKPSGGRPRVIFDQAGMVPYTPLDWSPDGEYVLVTISSTLTNTSVLTLVASDGSSSKALKTFDWRQPGRAKFSPDGRFVAYDFPPDPDSPERDLYLLSVDGSRDVKLTSGGSHDRLLDWHPSGILFQSNRGGTPGVWLQPVEQGRAAGPPKLLRADTWGHEPIGVAGGAYYFGVVAERPTLHTAAVDLAAGRVTSTPMSLTDAYGGVVNRGYDWSPDGRSLAHLVDTRGARPQLIIRSREGEEVRRIRLDLRNARQIHWAGDGNAVFVFGRSLAGQNGVHRVELESGTLETVLRSNDLKLPTYEFQFDVSADGQTVYVNTSAGENSPIYLTAFDLRTRTERRLARAGFPGHVARSPDGSRLAMVTVDEDGARYICVMPAGGGRIERVSDLSPPAGRQGYVDVRSLDWTPDGKSLIVQILGGGRGGIWMMPVDGGDPLHVESNFRLRLFWRGVYLSPDGRQLAFMAGQFRGEVWVMEDIADAVAAGTIGSR